MRKLFTILSIAMALAAAAAIRPAYADENATTQHFAVTREGTPIGTSIVRLRREGARTVADVDTHVRVTFASITLYRYDQHETEHWQSGELLSLDAETNDNGRVHKVSATRTGNALSVMADGKASQVDPKVMPVSLWNASLVRQSVALDPQDGKVTPLSVIDHGEERLVLQGRTTTARHYSIATKFPQDVWYDSQHRLLKVQLRGSDGSTISYQPG